MNREEAWELMCEYTQSPNLRRHMQAVEVAMRAYARKFGEDEEKWDKDGLFRPKNPPRDLNSITQQLRKNIYFPAQVKQLVNC